MLRQMRLNQLTRIHDKRTSVINRLLRSFSLANPSSAAKEEIEKIAKIISNHPFPDRPLQPILLRHIPPPFLTNGFVENVLGRLFAAHSNGLRALEFFEFSLAHSEFAPSADSFEKTLHILARMRYFDTAWELMKRMKREHPSLLTLKSMSIVMSKIAKFHSYEETLEAFEKMEKEIFAGREFGTEEFNVLLRVFCTEREMKEARSVFMKMLSRFPPDNKSMNILLLGFKDTGDVAAVELFYHEVVARGFIPNAVTYNIRIDAYCKAGCLADGLRLLKEMEQRDLSPTLATLTTLIHGAGVARNLTQARELFEGIKSRNMSPDTVCYNAYMSALIRCRDLKSAAALMDEMDEKKVFHDNMTYHNMFFGMTRKPDFEGVFWLYDKMIARGFVPQARTVVMLMRFFCENSRVDMGWQFWGYLIGKGYCPHGHTLELLLTGLCSRGLAQEAFECSKQVLERGRHLSEPAYRMVERVLLQNGEVDKLAVLSGMITKVRIHLPPSSRENVVTKISDSDIGT